MEAPGYVAAGLAASYLLFRERHRFIGALQRLIKRSRYGSLTLEKATRHHVDKWRQLPLCLGHDQLGVVEKWRRRLGRRISPDDGWEIAA
jgi:hypothetical protein